MTTTIFTHPDCLKHEMQPGHPESPDRLRSVLAVLETEEFASLDRREAPRVTREALERAHDTDYLDALEAAAPVQPDSLTVIDGDTSLNFHTLDAISHASGAIVTAVDTVMAGNSKTAFCATRPPGHHANRNTAMGFCFYNHVAVGALHARAVHGRQRVAILDFDVHHGNGTQDIFYDDADTFYGSTHQWPCYPGTGAPEERGVANNIVNAGLAPGSGSAEFRRTMDEQVLPALDAFAPDFILLSAGFDAHFRDPLANLSLNEEDFAWVTREAMALASRHCEGCIVSALEGGYDLIGLRDSVAAHVRALMGV